MNYKEKLKEALSIKFDSAFGLDIGDRSVEIIELQKFFRYSVVTYGRAELPEKVVEGGRILDQNVLAERLKKILKEAKPKKVSTNKVVVSLPEAQIFTICFELDAKLRGGALVKAILEKASFSMLVNIDKTYWDYVVNDLPDKTKKLVTFFCVPKEIAASYVKFCNSVGLEVVSLCLEPLSLARVILKNGPTQSLIMDIGSGSTNLNFFDSNDKLNVSITVPVAGERITLAIVEKLKIERDEAESLKAKFGIQDSPENTVRPIILPILEDILGEVKSAISYYEEAFKQKLDNVYLVGGTALLPGLVEMVRTSLAKEVTLGVSARSINFDSIIGKTNQFVYFANVLGLGMLGASAEFKRDVNILKKMPKSEANSVNKFKLFNLGYLSRANVLRSIFNNKIVLFMMVVAIGGLFYYMLLQVENYEKALIKDATPPEVILPTPLSVPSGVPGGLPPGMGGNGTTSSTTIQ
jgi:type IV pilus assembly protein PilM